MIAVLGIMACCWLMVGCIWMIVRYPDKAIQISYENGKLKFKIV